MSFQTSQDDLDFGPSGERILSSSIKGQIFEFHQTIYILYSEFINNQYLITLYNSNTQQKTFLYTSSEKVVIRTLQLDSINRKVWFGGYVEPMRGFIASTTISTTNNTFSSISSLEIKKDIKSVENILIINDNTILYTLISNLNECCIMTNQSNYIYKINTSLSSATIKAIYLRKKVYHIYIEGNSVSNNKNNQIEIYKIPANTLMGSF